MKITVKNDGDKPIYEQIYQQIYSQILNGTLTTDFCLPSIRVVAKELGISVITVKKAYELLEYDGFIYTRAGKGCFVKGLGEDTLVRKKTQLAKQKLCDAIPYFKELGVTKEELLALIEQLY